MTGKGKSGDADDGDRLSRDDIYTLLSNRRRRNVIHSLLDDGPASTIGELATLLAAWENGCPPGEVTSKQRKRVYTALRQTHLPKLAEAGVLSYDEDRGKVELTPAGSELRKYLWHPHEVRWTRFYAAACAVGVGLVGLSLLGLPPLGGVPPAVLASLVLLPFALLTGANFARTRRAVRDAHARDADTTYSTPSGPSWRSITTVSDGGHEADGEESE